MLQEALKTGKQEWQNMKEVITTNRDVIISKQTRVDTHVSQQTNISKEKATWTGSVNKQASTGQGFVSKVDKQHEQGSMSIEQWGS